MVVTAAIVTNDTAPAGMLCCFIIIILFRFHFAELAYQMYETTHFYLFLLFNSIVLWNRRECMQNNDKLSFHQSLSSYLLIKNNQPEVVYLLIKVLIWHAIWIVWIIKRKSFRVLLLPILCPTVVTLMNSSSSELDYAKTNEMNIFCWFVTVCACVLF